MAARHYRAAAELGHAEAQNNLAVLLARGLGVARDLPAALAWYRRAASGGNADALFNLGLVHESGEDLPVDRIAAHRWYNLGLRAGDPTVAAKARLRLEGLEAAMDQDELAEARHDDGARRRQE
ncbi:MAG: sel1 repeat family protein [Alphaproteobacteria bacterium]|nr:sel1 repeat family protein [Alphaproteobacteria bacterium]